MSDELLVANLRLIQAQATIAIKIAERGPWPQELEGPIESMQSALNQVKDLERNRR